VSVVLAFDWQQQRADEWSSAGAGPLLELLRCKSALSDSCNIDRRNVQSRTWLDLLILPACDQKDLAALGDRAGQCVDIRTHARVSEHLEDRQSACCRQKDQSGIFLLSKQGSGSAKL